MSQTISKAKLKPQLLKYLRAVQQTGEALIITDRGKPVLRIEPFHPEDDDAILRSLRGSVKKYIDPLEPVGLDEWDMLP